MSDFQTGCLIATAFAFLGWQARGFLADGQMARLRKETDTLIIDLTEFYAGLVFPQKPKAEDAANHPTPVWEDVDAIHHQTAANVRKAVEK
jgi:hypothetical protein